VEGLPIPENDSEPKLNFPSLTNVRKPEEGVCRWRPDKEHLSVNSSSWAPIIRWL
jgi:hypothetical protein